MGHSQAEKAQSHERILDEAARQIREGGLESVSVGGLMKSVNLTHGGFYGHFDSRSDLIAQALKRALTDSRTNSRASMDAARPVTFTTLVKRYLSPSHRDAKGTGCAIASLATDVGRADERARAIMEEHIESFVARVAATLQGDSDSDKQALVAVSAMIGALALSRAITDTKRSDEVLRTVRDSLIESIGNDA